MRICFLVPDGVGVKNYLYTDLLSDLSSMGHEVILLHSLASEIAEEIKKVHNQEFPHVAYKVFSEPFIVRFFREACSLARLHVFDKIENNPTIPLNWMPKKESWKKKLFFGAVESYAKRLKELHQIEKLENWIFEHLRKKSGTRYYESLWRSLKPDLIFCTHQRVPEAAFPILAAQNCDIETVTAIFSWDNLPKARLNIRCDRYLVWSDYMKDEMKRYYPVIPQESVVVSGTPQFQFYSKPSLQIDREEFAEQHGLDAKKHWICFSGDDEVTSPYDPIYLRDMAENLLQLPDIQILFREVPTEGIARYRKVIKSYSNLIHIPPRWEKSQKWNRAWPRYEDFSVMSALASHCEGIVNVGSTMAHDFSVNGKPCLFINYDFPGHGDWSVRNIYQFQHFRTMEGLNAVGWVSSSEDWTNKIQKIILSDKALASDRDKWYARVNEFEKRGGMFHFTKNLLSS